MIQKRTVITFALKIKSYCASRGCESCPFCTDKESLSDYCALMKCVLPENWNIKGGNNG